MNPLFTAAEIESIRARYPTEGAKRLAHDLGRPINAIHRKASALGIRCDGNAQRRYPHAKVWTEAEDQVIREQWPRVYRKQKTARQVADQLRLPVHQVRMRAVRLGVSVAKTPTSAWSDAETEYLCEHAHLGLYALQKHFKARGWRRSKAALATKLQRLGQRARGDNTETYSIKGLAGLLGIGEHPVQRWVRQGWLKAEARGPGQNRAGTPAEWRIFPKDVCQFIEDHTAQVDLSKADKFWLVDLLRGKLE